MASTAFVFICGVFCLLFASESFCHESSSLTHSVEITERKYEGGQKVTRLQASETGQSGHVKDDGYSLVPRELPKVCGKCQKPFGNSARRIEGDSLICDACLKSGNSPKKALKPTMSGKFSQGIKSLSGKFRKTVSKRRGLSNGRNFDRRSSENKRFSDSKQYNRQNSDSTRSSDNNNGSLDKKQYLDDENRNSDDKRSSDNNDRNSDKQYLDDVKRKNNQKFFDPEALMKCMLKAVGTSLPPFVISQISSKSLLSKIGGIFGMRFAEEPIGFALSPDVLDVFLEEAYLCFELFKWDGDRLIFDQEDIGTKIVVEKMKLRPMGALAVAATEALVEYISISYEVNREPPHYYVVENLGGLAGALGMAAVEANKAAESKPTESLDWLYGSGSSNQPATVGSWLARTLISQPANRNTASSRSTQVQSNELGKLLDCVLKAAKTSLGIPSVADLALGILRDQFSNIPLVAEFFRRPLNEDAPAAQSVLLTFIKEARPCFRFFKRDEDGKLVLDHEVLENTAVEAFRMSPLGALALGSAEAIAENVTAKKGKDGKVDYEYNAVDVATGLGRAFFQATKIGSFVRMGSQLAQSFIRA